MVIKHKILEKDHIFILTTSTICFLISMFINVKYNLFASILFIACGIIIFLIGATRKKTLLYGAGIFNIIWFITIGLSLLRVNINQIPWTTKTWIILWLTTFCFNIGYIISEEHNILERIKININAKRLRVSNKKITERRFFIVMTIFALICILAFLGEYAIRGFLPCLSSDMSAYIKFPVTGVHYFTVSCVLVLPLTIYYFTSFNCSIFKRIIVICYNLICFLIPLLIVSRQLYLMSVIISVFTLILLKENKILLQLIAIFIGVVIIITGWVSLSYLRNQNEEYITNVFDSSSKEYINSEIVNTNTSQEELNKIETFFYRNKKFSRLKISLPSKFNQPYMYMAFNYDNFNYAVFSINNHSYGAKTLFPIFALSNTKKYLPDEKTWPEYKLIKVYTTYPICYTLYYDFGIIGIIVGMMIIGYASGCIINKKTKSSIMNVIKSIVLYCISFIFFTNFFSNPTIWFYVIILIFTSVFIQYKLSFKRKTI